MPLVKKCRHGRGKVPRQRVRSWRRCHCQWYGDLHAGGVRVYLPLGHEEGAARIAYAKARADLATGKLVVARPTGHGFDAVARAWLDELEAESPPLRAGTLAAYRTRVNVLVGWYGSGDVRAIDSDELGEFGSAIEGRYSANYAREIQHVLASVLKFAVRKGLIATAPVRDQRRRRVETHSTERLSIEDANEVIAWLREAEPPLGDLAELALLTGLRRGELLGIRPDDVDLRNRTLRLEEQTTYHGRGPVKTRTSKRAVGLSARAAEILKPMVEDAPAGEPLISVAYAQAGREMRRAMKAVGVYRKGRGWHSFRHANTALRDQAGESLRSAAASLGHGARHAQTLSYGWATEGQNADPIDLARAAHVKTGMSADRKPAAPQSDSVTNASDSLPPSPLP